ncbi:small VCP/p97-interacting protein-like [Portunus trituberculatus]|uniref:small VCP/p97-interacting protein-like n=1 Tax=Portunus trituberculatus TaxID=210409 RepID=UPI001E1D1F81|nr:small VCP/p97-interacting protein-like [Portunus trituberculatus]XP_045106093.1 small VCP/p97-interacting protein-like [Portunus trituberculatus]XP_045106094.1 small VCP/p97-interacting protein-like [Portunus trituberculatus]XP_045106095.1 small VCP/p97-interacting protein-like [Portunus trituberculatus]XP_045106096.1 small VCP/p97-interacting protein-like [Portunus trituberculatus]
MGILLSCCGGGGGGGGGGSPSSNYNSMSSSVDPDTRRRQMAEAAEARLKAHEGRGLKNPEALKLRQKKIEELERKQAEEGLEAEGGLRWQVN